MDRLVLRFKGSASAYSNAVSAIEELNGVNVLDRAPKMLLVEATPSAAEELFSMPDWGVSPETYIPVPDTRKRIGRSVK